MGSKEAVSVQINDSACEDLLCNVPGKRIYLYFFFEDNRLCEMTSRLCLLSSALSVCELSICERELHVGQ